MDTSYVAHQQVLHVKGHYCFKLSNIIADTFNYLSDFNLLKNFSKIAIDKDNTGIPALTVTPGRLAPTVLGVRDKRKPRQTSWPEIQQNGKQIFNKTEQLKTDISTVHNNRTPNEIKRETDS